MAAWFDRVIATDASVEQISQAAPHDKVEYRIASAESSGLPSQSADLVTVAQGLHWLDPAAFFAEAKRVLRPGGAIAVWCYGDPILDTAELHEILHRFNRVTIEDYWLPERDLVLDGYRSIEFPFSEIETPEFKLTRDINLAQLMGYVRSWSATARFVAANGTEKVEQLEFDLAEHWGDPDETRRVEAPLSLRAGY